jgi:cell wall-associated NlpC family hydrolase
MPINAGHLLLVGGGGVFVWSGIAGKSVSSVFRQLVGGDSPTKATNANTIQPETPLAADSSLGISDGSGGTVPTNADPGLPSGAAGKMLSFMESKVGKVPYSENLSLRRGPNAYDCSGLVWAAAQSAGINIPVAMSNTTGEAPFFAAHGTAVKLASIQEGDIAFFVGGDPSDVPPWGPIGHVGMCSSGSGAGATLVSAYDTHSGICYTPFSQDHFVIGFRLGS